MTLDTRNLAFNSNYRYEHIAKDGNGNPLKGHTPFTVQTTYPNAVVTYSIPHNLGYIPFFKMWYTLNDGKYRAIACGPVTYESPPGFQMDNAYADANNLYFIADNSDGLQTISGTVYWRIYAEPQS